MNKKSLSVFSFALIFSLLLVTNLCFAQASLVLTTSSITAYQNTDKPVSVTLQNTDPANNITNISLTSIMPSGFSVNGGFSQSNFQLNANQSVTVTFTLHVGDISPNDYSIQINASGLQNNNLSIPISTSSTFTVTVQEAYCSNGPQGNYITRLVIDSDTEFNVGDSVDLTANVKADRDLDIIVEAQLWDATTQEELDSTDDSVSLNKNEESDDINLNLTIPLDVSTSDDIQLRVKAYEDGHESSQCYEKVRLLDITRESHKLMIDQINLNNENIQCSGDLSGYVKIANVGNHKESDITVTIKSTALNLSLVKNIDSLDKADTEKVSFAFTIPTTAKEGVYNLEILVDYSADTIDDYSSDIIIAGNCIVLKPDASVTVSQQGTGEVGQNSLSKITVINTGTTSTTYNIGISDYQNWAELVNLAPQTVTLSPGEKADIYLTLKPNSNAGSVNTFYVQVVFGENVKTGMGSMQVNKKASAGTFFSDLWDAIVKNLALAIINLILIIAVIILLIVALTRRSKKKEEPTEMRLKVKTNGNGKKKRK